MQLGFQCPKGNVLHADCKVCCLDSLHPCQLPPDILDAMRAENDHEPSPDTFSPSRLNDCSRKTVLLMSKDYYQNIDSAYKMWRGTAIHASFEKADYPALYYLREVRLKAPIETKYGMKEFTGKFDLIVVTKIEDHVAYIKVVDYKSKGEISSDFTEASADHRAQVWMYGWLLTQLAPSQLFPSELGVEEVCIEEVEITYIGHNTARRFTSAGPLSAKGRLLTQRRLNEGMYDNLEKVQNGDKTYEVLHLTPIRTVPMDVVKKWIQKKIEAKIDARTILPDILSGDDAWKCSSCQVKNICFEIGNKTNE